MKRRDFVRTLIAVSLAPKVLLSQQTSSPAPPPPAPVPWTLGLTPETPLPVTVAVEAVADTEASFFNASQMAALTRLCDQLLPPLNGKPGALDAGTPLFLDFLIGSSHTARRQVYTRGLDWLNAQSTSAYKLPFAQLDFVQADALLKPWLRAWMSDHPPMETHAEFVNIAHDDIRTATTNSEAWNDAGAAAGQDWITGGLYWSPIEPEVFCASTACGHVQPHVAAIPKAAHPIPSYPR